MSSISSSSRSISSSSSTSKNCNNFSHNNNNVKLYCRTLQQFQLQLITKAVTLLHPLARAASPLLLVLLSHACLSVVGQPTPYYHSRITTTTTAAVATRLTGMNRRRLRYMSCSMPATLTTALACLCPESRNRGHFRLLPESGLRLLRV